MVEDWQCTHPIWSGMFRRNKTFTEEVGSWQLGLPKALFVLYRWPAPPREHAWSALVRIPTLSLLATCLLKEISWRTWLVPSLHQKPFSMLRRPHWLKLALVDPRSPESTKKTKRQGSPLILMEAKGQSKLLLKFSQYRIKKPSLFIICTMPLCLFFLHLSILAHLIILWVTWEADTK